MGLTDKWEAGTLTQKDVFDWVIKQSGYRAMMASIRDNDVVLSGIEHVAMCLHHIYLWHMKGQGIGGFLTAVVRNDFKDACLRADKTNMLVLPLYARFLSQIAPKGYEIQRKYYAVST